MNSNIQTLMSDGQGIPTGDEHIFPYDYGQAINAKLRTLGWTPAQYDRYLDYLHQERSISELVADYLTLANPEVIKSDADALGIFEEEENQNA